MKKYCTNCKTINSETAIFCYKCGAKLIEQEQVIENTEKQKKFLPWKRIAIILFILFVITGAGFATYKIGMKKNSSEAYMQKFIQAMTTGQFDTAYAMLPIKNYKNLTVESFQAVYQPLKITSGEIKRQLSISTEDTFHLSFKNKADEELCAYEYTVQKQEKKKLLFFPTWAVTECDMIVENITITAPQNAVVTIDGVALDAQSMQPDILNFEELTNKPTVYQENWAVYHISAMWSITHTITASEPMFSDYEVRLNPTENPSLMLLNIDYEPSEQWRRIYAEFIRRNIDSLTASGISDNKITTICGFFDVDGDGIPEMFRSGDDFDDRIIYYVYTIRDGEVHYYDDNNIFGILTEGMTFRQGEIYITPDHRILVHDMVNDYYEGYKEYKLENGNLTNNSIVYYYKYSNEYGGSIYYDARALETSEISLKKFKNILKEYGCNFKDNKINLSGDALVNFYDIFTFYLYKEDEDWEYTFMNGAAESASDYIYEEAEINYHIDRILASYNLLTMANATALKDGKPVEAASTVNEPTVEDSSKKADNTDIIPDSAESSSVLAPQNGKSYSAQNLIDGKYDTVWAEGVEGVGIGESITLHLKKPSNVSGISFFNGYLASKDLYDKNGKVTNIRIDFGNEAVIEKEIPLYEITDFGKKNISNNCATYINLKNAVTTDKIVITILDAVTGNKYDDTCISEIEVY